MGALRFDELGEERFKRNENLLAQEGVKGAQKGADELPCGHRRGLAEGYRRLELEIHIHLSVGHGGVLDDWCITFYEAESGTVDVGDVGLSDMEGGDAAYTGNYGRKAVLVEVVELMQDAEQLPGPSVVRLQPLQACVQACWHDLSSADLGRKPIVEPLHDLGFALTSLRHHDWEHRRFPVGWRIDTRHDDRKPISKVVDGLPHVVHAIPYEQRNPGVVRPGDDLDPDSVLMGIELAIRNDQARVIFSPPIDRCVERVQVVECTREL